MYTSMSLNANQSEKTTPPPARIDVTFDREREVLETLLRLLRRALLPARSSPAAANGHAGPPVPRAAQYLGALSNAFGPLPTDALAEEPALVATMLLDASAVTALARGNPRARAFVARAVGSLAKIAVPATSLLDPQVATIAEYVADVVAIDARVVRRAAALMAEARISQPFEALAVACASFATPAAVVTAHAAAVGRLARAADQPGLFVFAI